VSDRKNKPNILFLLTDQHRYDAVSSNGAPVCQTPAMDEVANKGMRFTRAYTPIALCSPARGSIMTGLFPHNHGLLANMSDFNGVFSRQLPGKTNFPNLLRQAGYQTGFTGKWHISQEKDYGFWTFDRFHPNSEWKDHVQTPGVEDYFVHEVQRMEWGDEAPFCGRSILSEEDQHDTWVADQAIDMIRSFSQKDKPFFVSSCFFGPHFPFSVPEPYDTMYDPDSVERWGNFDDMFINKPTVQQKEMMRWNASHLTWPDWQKVIAHYWGYVSFIDAQIKRILDELKSQGLDENTIVIYTSDHGDMLGSHRIFNKGMNMYEETHHIPLMISWPSVTSPGTVCSDFVSLVDLMPTILEAGEATIPEKLDGRSLMPLLQGNTPEDWRDEIFCEFHGYEPALCTIRMVRTEKWKYVYNPTSEDELYDMESDPHELHNLAHMQGFKHVLRRMKNIMAKWLKETNDSVGNHGAWTSCPYDLNLSPRET
jgi:choline-sulfatase